MNQKPKKNKNISHFNPIRFIVGGHKGGDKKFLEGNDKLLKKLLQNFNKKP